jgi:hypothetical protein
MSLMLSRGSHIVTREDLVEVHTPEPTGSWCPISHYDLVTGVQATLERSGLVVMREEHGIWRDGARYFGLIEIANDSQAGDYGLIIGVRNSHDRSFPAELVIGGRVFVCDNLSFHGEVRLARRHTCGIRRDLPSLIERAVGQLGDLRHSQAQRFDAYKLLELSDSQVHDLVIQALDAQIVPATRIADVLAEYRKPRHQEFIDAGRTGWRLFNSFTEVLKGAIDRLPRRTQALHGLLDTACGLTK